MYTELDSVTTWGDDFRSNYVTGMDFRKLSPGTLDLYQGYIEIANAWGTPFLVVPIEIPDDDFPDLFHMSSQRAVQFSKALAQAWVEHLRQ